jgi:fructokinase
MAADTIDFIEAHKFKILCVGEVLWDLLPEGPQPGGAPVNVALHLKKFGLKVRFAGRVGNDLLGFNLRSFIESQGLDTDLLQVDFSLPTSTVEVHLESDNQPKFAIVDNVAWDRIELTKELEKASGESDIFIFGTLASRHSCTRKTILSILEKNDCLKFLDVNLRSPYDDKNIVEELVGNASIIKLNEDEIQTIAGWYNKKYDGKGLVKWFSEKYRRQTVCVTRGPNGALLYNNGQIVEHPGYKVKVNDCVGSGDAFLAGFLAAYLSGKPMNTSLEYGCATGALIAKKAGATPEYTMDEILFMIESGSLNS